MMALFTTMAIYAMIAVVSSTVLVATQRLFASNLSHIPGPKLAALSHWYEFYWNVVQPGRYIFKIQELHKLYGPIIRVAPNEVHINDVSCLDDVFPTSPLREREKNTGAIGVGMPLATALTQNHQLHRLRRDALNPFFSQRSVNQVESMIQGKIKQFVGHLDRAVDHAALNLSDLTFALARDVVFQYCFDRDCDLLDNIQRAATLRKNLNDLLLGVHVQVQLPWLVKVLEALSCVFGESVTPAGVQNMKELEKIIEQDVKEILSNRMANGSRRSVLEELYKHDELQEPSELPQRLIQEGVFLMMAGTESAAKTLTIAAFYMARDQDVMAKARRELAVYGSGPSLKDVGTLPYLNAMVHEANRLSFGLPGRVTARVAPHEVVSYKGFAIPPGTAFGMTTLAVHTNEEVFPEPWDFKPERWIGEEGKRLQKYQLAFGRGARKCLGINVANAEILLAIAALSQYNLDLFQTDLDDILIQHEYQVAYPKLDSKGVQMKISTRTA